MPDMDVTISVELHPAYVDAAGIQRQVGVDVIADTIDFRDDQIVVSRRGSPVFTGALTDVRRIRITDVAEAPPPRFRDRRDQEWTAEEDDALRELNAERMSTGRLAYALGRTGHEISIRINRLGLQSPPK
jgi:hypothetical protein